MPPRIPDYTIIFDGGCIGNPGRGYGSYAVTDRDGQRTLTRLNFAGRTTNNEAEYDTLIAALRSLAENAQAQGRPLGEITLDVRGDSLLVINQVAGRWKAHEPRMAERRDQVLALAKPFKRVTFAQHPRSVSVKALGH